MRAEPSPRPEWKWEDGVVDARTEHIELRHGDAGSTPYEEWIPVARIGKPGDRVFPVQWLIQQNSPEQGPIVQAARREMEFYLVEKGETDPWGYAQHHCNTGANMYSRIHWSYYPNGQEGMRVASMVVELPEEEAAKFFGSEGKTAEPEN